MSFRTRAGLVLAGLCLQACATSSPDGRGSLREEGSVRAEALENPRPVAPARTSIDGRWHGALELGTSQLTLELVLSRGTADAWGGTLDVPAQALRGLRLQKVVVSDGSVSFEATLPCGQVLSFEGTREGDSRLVGTFRQGGAEVPFWFARGPRPATARALEGEGWREEDVSFENGEVRLAGTLTLPRPGPTMPPPVAVLVTGSGPQDRNEEVFGFRVFEQLAHALARGGVATLRVDDRGVGGSSGDFHASTTADFATDVEAAVRFLRGRRDVDVRRVGIIGHSEGALIGPMVAARDDDIAFLVLLAGPAQRMDALLLDQIARVGRAEKKPEAEIRRSVDVTREALALLARGGDLAPLEAKLATLCPAPCASPEAFVKAERAQMERPWFRYFVSYDPAPVLAKVRSPVLALGGALDVQVGSDVNLPLLRRALAKGGNGRVAVALIPRMNHVLQRAQTGAVSEYATLPKELEPEVPSRILRWLAETVPVRVAGDRG